MVRFLVLLPAILATLSTAPPPPRPSPLPTPTLVVGVRRPDDSSDLLVHRDGKFINNLYVPGEARVEYRVTGRPAVRLLGRSARQAVPDQFEFQDFYSGRELEQRDATALESLQVSSVATAGQTALVAEPGVRRAWPALLRPG